jgi:alanyl-tRNA synthetase
MYRLVPLLAIQLKDVFPELHQQQEYVTKVVHEEEISFLRTLESGLKRITTIKTVVYPMPKIGSTFVSNEETYTISGEQAFELFDTYGFPFDLTSLIARENGWEMKKGSMMKWPNKRLVLKQMPSKKPEIG